MARVASGNANARVSGVIIEREADSDDDQFVVEEAGPEIDSAAVREARVAAQAEEAEESADHGALVKKMMASKEEYEGGNKVRDAAGPKRMDTVSGY